MEKEEGWKDVKKRVPKKYNKELVLSNETEDDFNSYCNTDVKSVAPIKPQRKENAPKCNTNAPKYLPPKMKNKNVQHPKDNKERGGRGYRGKWGRRGDIASIPDFENEEEKVKFTNLQKICPHIVMPGTARREAVIIRIDNYVEKILSEEWISFQCEGWQFVRIIKPDDVDYEIPDDGEYELLNLDNKYNDYALFKKV